MEYLSLQTCSLVPNLTLETTNCLSLAELCVSSLVSSLAGLPARLTTLRRAGDLTCLALDAYDVLQACNSTAPTTIGSVIFIVALSVTPPTLSTDTQACCCYLFDDGVGVGGPRQHHGGVGAHDRPRQTYT